MFFTKKLLLFLTCHSFLISLEFRDINLKKKIFLHAGKKFDKIHYEEYIGLNLKVLGEDYILCDLLDGIALPDNSVDLFHSEDVFEHIEYEKIPNIINEVFRILKVGGRMRFSVPDYRCDILYDRTQKDEHGNLLFDSGGNGRLVNGKVIDGGHVWFPVYETVVDLLKGTLFHEKGEVIFYHYYDLDGHGYTKKINYSYGYIHRTPDHDERVSNPYRPMSIVVDCIKIRQ